MKKNLSLIVIALIALAIGLGGGFLFATSKRTAGSKPVFGVDGTAHVGAFDLPPSNLASAESIDLLKLRSLATFVSPIESTTDVARARQGVENTLARFVKEVNTRYPTNVVEDKIANVPVRIFTPKDGEFDAERVLINLHGGGFMMCADACSILESAPIASVGKYKVVSVNYRMAPEATFPAASEDVAAVYQELLKNYAPKHIGIYGCSAGGMLSAQVAAWLPAHGLPQAGALGIFAAGGVPMGSGDSGHVTAYIDGAFSAPNARGRLDPLLPVRSYFDGVDIDSPLVSPARHQDVLATFPPTLLITGTRAMDMSPAAYTHSQLLNAGVDSNLLMGEGQGHCYIYFAKFPEARDAYRTIANFFSKNLQ